MQSRFNTWADIKATAYAMLDGRPKEYEDRLKFEISEIEKQGAEDKWVDCANKKFDKNPNGLVLPFLIGITPIDPIAAGIKHNIEYKTDFPDVDIDLLPGTREKIEAFAAQTYGKDKVCSVGLWQTYKPKLALQDAARALGYDPEPIIQFTKELPDEFDDLSYDEAIREFPSFSSFAMANKAIVDMAYRMVGGIKAQGRHAGGIIIANVPIYEHIPLTMCSGHWTSAWTEGHNQQLSKMGFVKFDLLGLKNLLYIRNCLSLIKKNRGITIEWSDIDPEVDRAGWLIDANGNRTPILINDKKALALANQVRTETVFQFETELAKSIIAKGGVKSFNDLVIYCSLGRPGPLPMIESYVRRRDGEEKWDHEHPKIIEKLKDTFGIIVFQEQLASIWQSIGGFTVPEAEAARKAVAKKRVEEFAPVKDKWLRGATKVLGEEAAMEWWHKMATFGRYAFNKSHATAYALIAHRCLYLKAHFPAEWWAAVMSDCDTKKLAKYVGYARADGVKLGGLDCNNFSLKFDVIGDTIIPGLLNIKNMDSNTAYKIIADSRPVNDIDDFVQRYGRNKVVCERLIKLGAFKNKHNNNKATWLWYQFAYGTDDESKEIRKKVKCLLGWSTDDIQKERQRQANEYFKQYPNRKAIPAKIKNWLPKIPKIRPDAIWTDDHVCQSDHDLSKFIQPTRDQVMGLVKDDFTLKEMLNFEREYLGYCNHSPMDLYKHSFDTTIQDAKESGVLEACVEKFSMRKKNVEYGEIIVTDGIENARVIVWKDELTINGIDMFKEGRGLRMRVIWNDRYNSFNLRTGSLVVPLEKADVA
ncbi:MAG: hypothetical protein QXP41_00550 [Candidatus Nitrosocaldus sp.]